MRSSSKVTWTHALARGVAVGRGVGAARFALAGLADCGDGNWMGVAAGGRGVSTAVGDASTWGVGCAVGGGVATGGAMAAVATNTGMAAAGVLVGGTMMRTGVGGAVPPHPASAPAAMRTALARPDLRMI